MLLLIIKHKEVTQYNHIHSLLINAKTMLGNNPVQYNKQYDLHDNKQYANYICLLNT